MLNRRRLLTGLGLTLAAPAIVRTPGLLMPVHSPRPLRLLNESELQWVTGEWWCGDGHSAEGQYSVAGQYRTPGGTWVRVAAPYSLLNMSGRSMPEMEAHCRQKVIAAMNRLRREKTDSDLAYTAAWLA